MTIGHSRPKQILDWAISTFGVIAILKDERASRFLEEALELAQAQGLREAIAETILARVYARKPGDVETEIGQALLTLECLAENLGLCADELAGREFDRIQKLPRDYFVRRQNVKAEDGVGRKVQA